ncbi:hypothetical protein BH23GEM6_BH23GEM6_11470 [soil metagenome]
MGILKRLLGLDRDAEEPFLNRVKEGGAPFRQVVFTTNRRVMISVGEDRATLRVHERFRSAPPEVQRAIGQLYSRRGALTREAARVRIRDFLAEHPPEPHRPRVRWQKSGDDTYLRRLRQEFEQVNQASFGGSLPGVPIHLSGRMRRRNGHFSIHPLEIVISRRLCVEAAPGEAERTLRHEMIHLWQHTRGERPNHGAEFRRMAVILDVHPRATRAVEWLDDC